MSRRPVRHAATFSLFPFLAVLLCTMGSLIVLLLIVVRQGKAQAETLARQQQQPAEVLDDSGQSEAEAKRRLEEQQRLTDLAAQLGTLRDDFKGKLEHSRLDLSHLEDHIRRLHEQLKQMEGDYQVLKQSQPQGANATSKLAELMQLQKKLEKGRAELEAARAKAASKPRSFAIVPYDGPHGTHRRPIYIECQADKLIIQPEGIVLLPSDFEGRLDAGNPLAAALRAEREYLHGTGALQGGEPYPLLLVRPDGAQMYSAARAAMESWSSEYGYELIDADMQLAFPPGDEALGDVVRRTVNISRQRGAYAAMRRQPTIGAGGGAYGGSGMGSGGPGAGGHGVGGGESAHDGQNVAASGNGGPNGPHGSTPGTGGGTGRGNRPYLSASRDGGFTMQGGNDPSNDWLDRHVRSSQSPTASTRPPTGTGGSGGGENGPAAGGRSVGPFYASEQPGVSGSETGSPSGNAVGNAGVAGGSATASAGSPSSQYGPAGGMDQNPLAPPQYPDQPAPVGLTMTRDFTKPPPLSQTRGSDWALPGSARGATPFTRPIRVACYADKLVVLPDRGSTDRQRVVALDGPLAGSVDRFVAELWQHVNHWGIAGPRAYWKPILSVEVAPGGEMRYEELAALMDSSGVEVQRKN